MRPVSGCRNAQVHRVGLPTECYRRLIGLVARLLMRYHIQFELVLEPEAKGDAPAVTLSRSRGDFSFVETLGPLAAVVRPRALLKKARA